MRIVKWALIMLFWMIFAGALGFVFVQFALIVGGGNAVP